jgi:hypothetical protein
MYSSGLTVPWTTFSPKPKAAVITITWGNPVSVSMEKMTPAPALSDRTIFCTPPEISNNPPP